MATHKLTLEVYSVEQTKAVTYVRLTTGDQQFSVALAPNEDIPKVGQVYLVDLTKGG